MDSQFNYTFPVDLFLPPFQCNSTTFLIHGDKTGWFRKPVFNRIKPVFTNSNRFIFWDLNLFLGLSTSVELIRSRPGLRRRPVQLVLMFVTCGMPRQLEICHIHVMWCIWLFSFDSPTLQTLLVERLGTWREVGGASLELKYVLNFVLRNTECGFPHRCILYFWDFRLHGMKRSAIMFF